jgi:hypothetical protein
MRVLIVEDEEKVSRLIVHRLTAGIQYLIQNIADSEAALAV